MLKKSACQNWLKQPLNYAKSHRERVMTVGMIHANQAVVFGGLYDW